ncbi:MAG TPA: hypothetical protein VFT06_15440 [Flavisolibacter sp.]|nr:hypothetical protein [Flavisolibacter sp.]
MKRIFLLSGLVVWLCSCSDNSISTGHTDSATDTTKNMTTNSGAAGTGGVGAGYGTGGSAGTDTNTNAGADTSRNDNH